MYEKVPSSVSSSTSISTTFLPSPNQLFSLILNANDPPLVPKPAPALISPVGFSSSIFITFKLSLLPSFISYLTSENIFLDLILDIDFSKLILVRGSPSSRISSPLITFSLVILFPVMFILSTKVFSPSNTFSMILIVSPSILS